MPLLSKRIFNCVKALTDVKPDENIYTIEHTKEQFRSQEEYEKRLLLYKKRIWTCQSTGHVNLTHEEAWNSERAVLKTLKEQFPPCYDKPVLELVHHCTKSLDVLVDEAWLMLQQVLVIGERVLLKVKSGSKSMKAVIVKVDSAGCKGSPTSNCNSPSSDKENNDTNESSQKKWVPPKLLPYKYSIRFENEDSVIHSVPADDLSRGDKPPSKELLRLFIRTYAVRAGQTTNSPWIVDETQVKKLDLQNKFASFLLSPVKWRPDEIAKKIEEEIKHCVSPSKGSQRIKSKMDAKEEKRKEKVNRTISQMEKKREKAKQAKEKTDSKTSDIIIVLESSDNSSSDGSDSDLDSSSDEQVEIMSSDSDSDTPLSVVKNHLTPKKNGDSNFDKSEIVKKTKKVKSLADLKNKYQGKNKDGNSKKQLTLADLKKRLERKKLKSLKKNMKDRKSKKGQDPKQPTLFDLSKKKGLKTTLNITMPTKEQKTPDSKHKLTSPPRTPIIIQKLQLALKRQDKMCIGMYSTQAAKLLNAEQQDKLPQSIKDLVVKKYELIQERAKLSKMTQEEKKAYFRKKAEDKKKQYRNQKKKLMKNQRKKFEDTELDLQPLPPPKLVITPDGLPNEKFGDITMVTEFISCYAGLLMPDDEYPIYTDALMKALVSGKDGFTYLSRVLTVLLQTLLQDQLAEDYRELNVPLTEIPVNPCTCSELVRLCLRKLDDSDNKSDKNVELAEDDDGEVSDELLDLLENKELYQLDPVQKADILKGLCLRIMSSYSVQDYMEEKQQNSARLWREKQAFWKEEKAKKVEEQHKKAEEQQQQKDNINKPKEGNNGKSDKDLAKNMILTQFYGKKVDEDGHNSGNSSETAIDTGDDNDTIAKIKRRRMTTAQALEERRRKEKEERIRREKELEISRQQKERELFDKEFTEGILLAKITQRQTPIGTDRNHSRYWIFCDVTPGVFVEKGWVGGEMEYTCRKDTGNNDEESSSSEEDEEEVPEGVEVASSAKKNKPNKVAKCIDTTFPQVGQNLWFTYDSKSQVNELIATLHPQGSRESRLKRELLNKQADISLALYRQKRYNMELRDCDGDKEMLNTLKKELLETELRLCHGGLGGVDDFKIWSSRLETAEDVATLADCLLECQACVLEKFRNGIMEVKKKKSAIKEEEEEEDEESTIVASGIQSWRDAVQSASTLSRLHVLLGILESCIKWEKSAVNAKCKICRKKGEDDKMLLCDDCNQAFHIFCLRPALPAIPKGDWKCVACAPQHRKRVVDVPGKYQEYSDEDEEIKEAKTKSIKHDRNCVECGGDANLIECAECPSAYHLECHEPPLRHPPRGRWVCNDCKNGITRKTRAGTRPRGSGGRKRKRYVVETDGESTSEESSVSGSDTEEETKPATKKARTSRGSVGVKRGPKPKSPKAESPKSDSEDVGKVRGKHSLTTESLYERVPKTSRRAPSELSVIEDIINKMLEFKFAWPFWNNVSKKDVPDYYDIIKQPISFQRIKDRLNCLVYGSPQEVLEDVALLFRNAVEYNKIGSEVYDCIDLSEKHFVELLKRHLPFYAYNREIQSTTYNDQLYQDHDEGRKSHRSK